MKTLYSLLLILFFRTQVSAVTPISIEDFKKITDGAERDKIINEAPPEQKEALQKANLHLVLRNHWGGEKELQEAREFQVAYDRGLGWLEQFFIVYDQLWDGYVGAVLAANAKAGMDDKKQVKADRELTAERDSRKARLPIVHSLVFKLAASPQALELATKAEQWGQEMSKRVVWDGSTAYRPITKKERIQADKRADEIFKALHTLPSLTPEQAQKEFDALTEDKMRPF